MAVPCCAGREQGSRRGAIGGYANMRSGRLGLATSVVVSAYMLATLYPVPGGVVVPIEWPYLFPQGGHSPLCRPVQAVVTPLKMASRTSV